MNEYAFLATLFLTMLMVLVAYRLGQNSILKEFEEYSRKRRERERRWREFEEDEE